MAGKATKALTPSQWAEARRWLAGAIVSFLCLATLGISLRHPARNLTEDSPSADRPRRGVGPCYEDRKLCDGMRDSIELMQCLLARLDQVSRPCLQVIFRRYSDVLCSAETVQYCSQERALPPLVSCLKSHEASLSSRCRRALFP